MKATASDTQQFLCARSTEVVVDGVRTCRNATKTLYCKKLYNTCKEISLCEIYNCACVLMESIKWGSEL